MNRNNNQISLDKWYADLKEQGQCKAIKPNLESLENSLPLKHTRNIGVMQIPIVSSSLVDRFARKIEQSAKKADTLESLFNIF